MSYRNTSIDPSLREKRLCINECRSALIKSHSKFKMHEKRLEPRLVRDTVTLRHKDKPLRERLPFSLSQRKLKFMDSTNSAPELKEITLFIRLSFGIA